MLEINKYYTYSLDNILKEQDEYLKRKVIELRNRDLQHIGDDNIEKSLIKDVQHMSLEDIYRILEERKNKMKSRSIFPGQFIKCYPQIKEVKASKQIICNISGSIIKKGSIYINYDMFMVNLSDGHSYVLVQPLKSELGYRDFFPRDINELDILDERLNNSSECYDEYDYNNISSIIGNSIRVRKLGKNELNR